MFLPMVALVLLIELVLLRKVNLPVYRYYQIWSPAAVLLIHAALLFMGFGIDTNWSLQLFVEEQIIRRVQDIETIRPLHRFYVYNLAVGAGFIILKFLVNLLIFLFVGIMRFFGVRVETILQRKSKKKTEALHTNGFVRAQPVGFIPGYIYIPDRNEIVVSGTGYYLRTLFKQVAIVFTVYTVVLIGWRYLIGTALHQPFYFITIIMFFFELAWFLDHEKKEDEESSVPEDAAEKESDKERYFEDLVYLWSGGNPERVDEERQLLRMYRSKERLFHSTRGGTLGEAGDGDDEESITALLRKHMYDRYPVILDDPREKKLIDELMGSNREPRLLRYAGFKELNRVIYALAIQAIVHDTRIIILTSENSRQNDLKRRIKKELHFIDISDISERSLVRVETFDSFDTDLIDADILICSQNQLLAHHVMEHREEWFKRVSDVCAYDVRTSVFENPILLQTMLLELQVRNTAGAGVRVIIVADDRDNLLPAVEENIGKVIGSGNSCSFAPEPPKNLDVLLWKSEGEHWLQNALYRGYITDYLGIEQCITKVGFKWGLLHQLLVQQWNQPWKQIHALHLHHFPTLDEQFLSKEKDPVLLQAGEQEEVKQRIKDAIEGEYSMEGKPFEEPWGIPAFEFDGDDPLVLIVRDEKYNWPNAVKNFTLIGSREIVIHIISPPYLLRNYMVAFDDFFLREPVRPLSPVNQDPWISLFYRLVHTLVTKEMSEDELAAELHGIPVAEEVSWGPEVEKKLLTLLGEVLLPDHKEEREWGRVLDYITTSEKYVFLKKGRNNTRGFRKVRYYRVKGKILKENEVEWMRLYELRHHGKVVGSVPYDHLYQLYFPGKIFAKDGERFRVERIIRSEDTAIVDIERVGSHKEFFYRQDISFALLEEVQEEHKVNEYLSASGGTDIVRYIATAHFTVDSRGVFEFENGFSLLREGADSYEYTNFSRHGVPTREYTHGRILTFQATPQREEKEEEEEVKQQDPDSKESPERINSAGRLSFTFAVLLQELLPSLYPEVHELVHVVSPISLYTGEKGVPAHLYPNCTGYAGRAEGSILVHVFEDSHLDLGVVFSLFKNWERVMDLMQDYLKWSIEEELVDPKLQTGADPGYGQYEAEKRDFLKYCMDEYPEELDLQGVYNLLNKINPENQITISRTEHLRRLE